MAIGRKIGMVGNPTDDANYAEAAASYTGGDGIKICNPTSIWEGRRKPYYLEVSHSGKVLSTGERNGYHDSDFFANVWDGEGVTQIEYATTRFPTYENFAVPDATPEIHEAYVSYEEAREAERLLRRRKEAVERAIEKAKANVKKGDKVKVVRGRKVPRGTTGEVFWVGTCKYSGKARIGLRDESGETHWLAASNCEPVSPLTDLLPSYYVEEAQELGIALA